MMQLELIDVLDAVAYRPRRRELPAAEVEALLSHPVGEMDYDPRWCRPLAGRKVEVIDSPRFR